MGLGAPISIAAPEPLALAAAVDRVQAEAKAAADRARSARTLVTTFYNWDRAVQELERVYGLRREQAA
jgi:hypothetical protein